MLDEIELEQSNSVTIFYEILHGTSFFLSVKLGEFNILPSLPANIEIKIINK